MNDIMILNDSPEAARYVTGLSGWVSRNGKFFGNTEEGERLARYDGCTHIPCKKCGTPTNRNYTLCPACQRAYARELHARKDRAPWHGKMIYSYENDEYYDSPDDARDALEDGQTMEDLRLVLCVPTRVQPIPDDYCHEELPEDGEMPDELLKAIEAFNTAVAGIILSWAPGKIALEV